MFHIRKSMKEVQSTCQKVKLSEKSKVLLSELPLSVKEQHRLLNYTKRSIDYGGRIPVDVSLDETKIRLLLNLMYDHF